MLLIERSVREARKNESLEKRTIQVEPVTSLDGQGVVVDFGTKLLVITDEDELFGFGCHSREYMAFENLSGFFHDDDAWCCCAEMLRVLSSSGGSASDDTLAPDDVRVFLVPCFAQDIFAAIVGFHKSVDS